MKCGQFEGAQPASSRTSNPSDLTPTRMNLRDLIYSQSQASHTAPSQAWSQSQVQTPGAPASQQSYDPQYDLPGVYQPPQTEDYESEVDQPTKRRRVGKAVPTTRKLPVYGDSPLVLQQIEVERDRANGAKMPRFAPGMNGYAHFAQREVPFAAFQRDVVRRLWLQCYYGKDFEGAAMALSVLAEIDPLTPTDVSAAARMLRYADNQGADSLKKLVQGILKPHPRDADKRHSAIALGIDLLLSLGDLKTARKVLTEHSTEFTATNRQELKAYDTLVIVASVVNLAAEVCRLLHAALPCPTVEEVSQDPLEFNKCVNIVHMARTATSFAAHKLKAKRQECNRILQDLKGSFVLSVTGTTAPVEHDRLNLEALYVAYLYGVGHETKAIRYITNLKKAITNVDSDSQKFTLCKYYNLLSTYLARYRYTGGSEMVVSAVAGGMYGVGVSSSVSGAGGDISSSISVGTASSNSGSASSNGGTESNSGSASSAHGNPAYTKIVKALIHQFEYKPVTTPTSTDVRDLVTLHRIGALDAALYAERVCELIELTPSLLHNTSTTTTSTTDNTRTTTDTYGSDVHYALWHELSTTLGPVTNTIGSNDTISATSDIYSYMPAITANTTTSTTTTILTTIVTAVTSTAQTTLPPLQSRAWWRTSVLSPTQYDTFSVDSAPNAAQSKTLVESVTSTAPTSTSAAAHAPPTAPTTTAASPTSSATDHYTDFTTSEVQFATSLTAAFASRHRKMSEDMGSEGESSDEDGTNTTTNTTTNTNSTTGATAANTAANGTTTTTANTTKGKRKGKKDEKGSEEEVYVANTSHDDTDYHSNESGEENNGGAVGSEGSNSNSGSGVVGYTYSKDVLSMAVQYHPTNTANADLLYSLYNTVADFTVSRVTTYPTTSTAPNSLAARLRRPVVEFVLGSSVLHVLCSQAIVSAHLYSQDNMLTVRVVQIIVAHALREQNSDDDAATCTTQLLQRLHYHNINLTRALKIGAYLCRENIDITVPTPTVFKMPNEEVKLGSASTYEYMPMAKQIR